MQTIYLKETQFDRIKAVETFPNKDVKIGMFKNKLCILHKSCNIIVKKPTKENLLWHGLKENSYILTSTNGFFPSSLLFTVKDKKYFDGLNIGANNGCNLGTASIGVIDLETAKKILIKNNFNIIENE